MVTTPDNAIRFVEGVNIKTEKIVRVREEQRICYLRDNVDEHECRSLNAAWKMLSLCK